MTFLQRMLRERTLSGRTLGGRTLGGGAAMATAALVILAAGCSSSPSSSSSSAPVPGRSTAATSASATSASATSAAPTVGASTPRASAVSSAGASSGAATPGAAAGGPPACPTRYLKATAGIGQGAAGSIYQVIDFTNISSAPCTLYGYPGVALAGGSPVTQVGAAASRSTVSAATLVILGAGKTANALLRITQAGNYPPSECDPHPTTYLQIYPPNQTTPIYLGYKSTGCSASAVNLLSIGVVQPGKGG
jgi:Protein of unknown function (DUF4232)